MPTSGQLCRMSGKNSRSVQKKVSIKTRTFSHSRHNSRIFSLWCHQCSIQSHHFDIDNEIPGKPTVGSDIGRAHAESVMEPYLTHVVIKVVDCPGPVVEGFEVGHRHIVTVAFLTFQSPSNSILCSNSFRDIFVLESCMIVGIHANDGIHAE